MTNKPTASIIRRTSKKPSKAELNKMKKSVEAIHKEYKDKQKQKIETEDIPMTKTEENTAKATGTGKGEKPRKRLSNEQGIRMIKEWDTKSVQEWADEFGVSYQTISNMAKVLNKKNASLCPPKTAKPKKREDIADEWIALLEKEQGKN